MNPQLKNLKDLAMQAGMEHPVMGEISYDKFSYEKFAKLIIKECCKEIEEEPFNATAASVRLKQHFGLK